MTPERLLCRGTPCLDVRAPVEFAKGALPNAVNLPLLEDDERHAVGVRYKQAGPEAALALGHELVSGDVKTDRIAAWVAFVEANPAASLYCWRGGQRSSIVQAWLAEAGHDVERIDGGFKAVRAWAIGYLERLNCDARRWLVVGGRTGSGKTDLVRQARGGVDLEGLANHRGSAFGARDGGQPTPVGFELALAGRLLARPESTLVLEDEGRTIGALSLPRALHERMASTPLVVVDADIDTRAARIAQEYVDEPLRDGTHPQELHGQLQTSLDRIQRRLGGARHRDVTVKLKNAFSNGDHVSWIKLLLTWYYDPMYDHQLGSKRDRIIFRGPPDAIARYLEDC